MPTRDTVVVRRQAYTTHVNVPAGNPFRWVYSFCFVFHNVTQYVRGTRRQTTHTDNQTAYTTARI